MNKFCCLWLAIFLVNLSAAVFAQKDESDITVKLQLGDDKTVFQIGEPIRLILTFTAAKDGYTLNARTSKIESSLDSIIVLPNSDVFDWANQYRRSRIIFHDDHVIDSQKLTTELRKVELMLNDFVRFDKAGRYTVQIKTKRVSKGDFGQKDWKQVELTTNEIKFEIREMSEAEEAARVKKLSAQLDVKQDWQTESKIAEELSYLTGDAATREKVRLFLAPQDRSGNYYQNIYLGLFMARNQQLIIKTLENALRDTSRPASYQWLNALVHLRLISENAEDLKKTGESYDARQKRWEEVRQGYLRELVESLPQRTGKSRTTTAITILDNLPRENPAADVTNVVREVLLAEFDNLHIYEKERLLRAYWNILRDPLLVPALEQTLTNASPQDFNTRSTALERLIEMDQAKARPFVIAEINNSKSVVTVEVLGKLDDQFLPETENALLAQINELGKKNDYVLLRLKSQLAARFATANIYDGLMQVYKSYSNQWFPDARASLLGYFVRHNDAEAVALIEEALAKIGNGSEFSFFGDLTKINYSQGINNLLLGRLNRDDWQAASTAAYLMAKYGSEENRALIEARLERWIQEWRGRAAQFDAPNTPDNIKYKAMFQVNVIEALMNARSWKLSEAEIIRLKQNCISERCRQYFRLRKL